ncbi:MULTISPECIES: tripartite tricarboxylate transporter TctB family protein [Chelativorans]|jgi:hypothetical protein|uniref:DUF1468 domain-containing protein n=1 Tax=Chelativorans sp. (strain BNC1) TaxID=266779 RepID=Q11E84_CHESB|nr:MULTISPECIES: tripartite tricarboxylate transporter TctB family protein [Chelativorans]
MGLIGREAQSLSGLDTPNAGLANEEEKMKVSDYGEFASGALLIAVGLFATGYALTLPMGSWLRIGPGAFPFGAGVILLGCGIATILPGFLKSGSTPRIEVRPALAVLGGGLVFALLIEHVGLIPSVFALVLIVATGDDKLSIRAKFGLAIVLSALTFAIFKLGLSLPVPAVEWSF